VIPLQLTILLLVAGAGLAVVQTRDPLRQVIVTSFYGLLLIVLFLVFQAPDVALSMLVVGGVGYPVVILIAIVKVRSGTTESDEKAEAGAKEEA
jgi:energy-converting hydrogenase B subunit D